MILLFAHDCFNPFYRGDAPFCDLISLWIFSSWVLCCFSKGDFIDDN